LVRLWSTCVFDILQGFSMPARDEQLHLVHGQPPLHQQGLGSRRRCNSEPPPCVSAGASSTDEGQVLSDLEAFFQEYDLSREPEDATASWMKDSDMEQLRRIRYKGHPSSAATISADAAPMSSVATTEGDQISEDSPVECVVCLSTLEEGEWLLEMPCDERHRLHEQCAQSWLARSAACPLCRVDARTLLPGLQANAGHTPRRIGRRDLANGQHAIAGARTRDGGIISKFEPNPPENWARPVYIPERFWHLAQYFEVSYQGLGVARVWRVAGSFQMNQPGPS